LWVQGGFCRPAIDRHVYYGGGVDFAELRAKKFYDVKSIV